MAHLFFEAASPIIKMYYRRDVTASPPHKVTSPQSHGGFAIRNTHVDDSYYKSGVTMENGVTRLK